MKILAINGSPRKSWNTATLLQEALKGAAYPVTLYVVASMREES